MRAIVRQLDPALLILAHEGTATYAETDDRLHRHTARRPNAIWQADHSPLPMNLCGAEGLTVRPWLTIIEDDYRRAIAGYRLSLADPTAFQTALAFRACRGRVAHPGISRGALVRIMQAAEDRDSAHAPALPRLGRGAGGCVGGVLVQALMGPVTVVIGHVFPQRPPQVRLPEDEEMVQALPPCTAAEPLAGGVLPGRTVGRPQLRDAGGGGDAGEGRPVLAIVVADEEPGPLTERCRLAQLLGNPGVGRVARDADMRHAARISAMTKQAWSGRKSRSVTGRKSQAQIAGA